MQINKEQLFDEYIIKKQNIETVAKVFNTSRDIIKRKLKKYNIHKDRRDIFFQAKEAYDKTMLERYGTTSPIKNEQIKEKINNTVKEKYGVSHISQSLIAKEKTKKTNLERYGVEYGMQNEKIKNKARITCLNKYGVDNPAKNEIVKNKIRETSKRKYGINNAGGSFESIEKAKQTNLKKYGIDYTGRLKEFRIKAVKSSKNNKSKIDGKRFDSSYERDLYDYCKIKKIPIQDMQVPLEYNYKGKKHITFIDFKINNKLIECKGGHLLEGVFDNLGFVPIEIKMKIYLENEVMIVTDEKGIASVKKYSNQIIVQNIKTFKNEVKKYFSKK